MSTDSPPRPVTAATVGCAAVGFVVVLVDAVFDVSGPLHTVGGVLIAAGVLALAWWERREGANAAAATLAGAALCTLAASVDDLGVDLLGGLLSTTLLLVGIASVVVGARGLYAERSE